MSRRYERRRPRSSWPVRDSRARRLWLPTVRGSSSERDHPRRNARTASTRRCESGCSSRRSLRKICVTCASTVRSVTYSRAAIALFDRPSATSARTSRSRSLSAASGSASALPPEQAGHDRRVDDRLAFVDATDRLDERRRGEDPVLEQVADPLGVGVEQPHRVRRLDVLREHEHGDVGVVVADSLGGDEPLVGVCRWHLDVDDGDVGCVLPDLFEQLVGVLGLADDVDAGVARAGGRCLRGSAASRRRLRRARDLRRAVRRRRFEPPSEGPDAVGELDDQQRRRARRTRLEVHDELVTVVERCGRDVRGRAAHRVVDRLGDDRRTRCSRRRSGSGRRRRRRLRPAAVLDRRASARPARARPRSGSLDRCRGRGRAAR